MDTPQQSTGGAERPSSPPSQAAGHPIENAPLTITFFTKDGRTLRYAEATAAATLALLRADILEGWLPYHAKAKFETRVADGNPKTIQGTLLKCALKFPELADLYMPVRRRAMLGLGRGFLVGAFPYLLVLGYVVFMRSGNAKDDVWGEMIIALPGILIILLLSIPVLNTGLLRRRAQIGWGVVLMAIYVVSLALVLWASSIQREDSLLFLAMLTLPICGAVLYLIPERKLRPPATQILAAIQLACAAALVFIVFSLGQQSALFGGVLGAVSAGGLLFGLPGMAIGAAVGAAQRRKFTRASDAPREFAALRILIPLLLSAALWTAYTVYAPSYLMPQLK